MMPGAAFSDRDRGRRTSTGFTLVELLTIIALVAVLATLVTSSIAGAKLRSQQTFCAGNLRQIAVATEVYASETGKRPRSVSRLIQRSAWLADARALLCPSDPSLRTPGSTNSAWGNVANASQEPWNMNRTGFVSPENGSWQAELAESVETASFSYLHTLGWRLPAWQRLTSLGKEAGIAVCQLHGVKVPAASLPNANSKPYMNWEGRTFRAQRDGAVVPRKIFRSAGFGGAAAELTTTAVPPAPGTDYPWEFYADSVPADR